MDENRSICNSLNVRNNALCNINVQKRGDDKNRTGVKVDAVTEGVNYIYDDSNGNYNNDHHHDKVTKGKVSKRSKKCKGGKNTKRELHNQKTTDINNSESIGAMLTPSQNI